MSIAEILSFAFVTALLIISPGPNGILIAKTVPASGRGAGFANIAGFVAAFYVHGTLSICGISLLLAQSGAGLPRRQDGWRRLSLLDRHQGAGRRLARLCCRNVSDPFP
jgi:hypothetical protein